jgi:cobalt-zinc-cadmium efflux system protein
MKNTHNHDPSEHIHCHGDHDHAHPYAMPNERIKIYTKAWALTWAVAIIEVVGSILSGSLALLADVTHVITDTIMGLAPVSVELAKKKKSFINPENIERAGGILASIILIAVGISVLHEAGESHSQNVNGIYMFIFALIAAGANYLQHKILSRVSPMHRHSAHAGFHFHILTDFAKNLALPLVAIAIALGAPSTIDIIAAKAIGIIIILRSVLLASESIYGHNFVQDFIKKAINKIFQ